MKTTLVGDQAECRRMLGEAGMADFGTQIQGEGFAFEPFRMQDMYWLAVGNKVDGAPLVYNLIGINEGDAEPEIVAQYFYGFVKFVAERHGSGIRAERVEVFRN